MNKEIFHLSLPCSNIQETKKFYINELGFEIGRSSFSWFDVNIFGNQITFTVDENAKINTTNYEFEDVMLPSFHFGVILNEANWNELFERYKKEDYFVMTSQPFLHNQKGEHKSFFLKDPNGYFVEFKNFVKIAQIFESD